MSGIPQTLQPVNRHLTIVPHVKKKETNTGVLLPDDFKFEEDRFIVATVVDVARDCASQLQAVLRASSKSKIVIVDRTMIQKIKLKDKIFHVILENYVIGFLRGSDELR